MKTTLFILPLLFLPLWSDAQCDSIRSVLNDRYWSLESKARSYLHTHRHSKDKKEMRCLASDMAKQTSNLYADVTNAYGLDASLQRALHQDPSLSHTDFSTLPDSVMSEIAENTSKMIEEAQKEHPYWLWTLSEISRITCEIGRSKSVKQIQRWNQVLSTVVPLD